MERGGDDFVAENSHPNGHFDGAPFFSISKVFLDRVGEVNFSLNSSGLSWKLVESDHGDDSPCLGWKFPSENAAEINFSDVYAAELAGWGSIRQLTGYCFMHQDVEMYRFVVHSMQRSKANPSLWQLVEYVFGHKDQLICQMLVDKINAYLEKETERPKSLLVFVNPKSGKGKGQKIWGDVAPIFSRAKVKAQVTVTERAGHAFDVVASMANRELNSYDGIVAVGGDGLFNEILNGLLTSRIKTTYPPVPPDFMGSRVEDSSALVPDPNERFRGTLYPNEDHSPLLPTSTHNESGFPSFRNEDCVCSTADEDVEFSVPHKWFRFGIIPAGSTDAIVICSTGARDPVTSALHIVLGKRIGLDIAQVVKWKETNESKVEPSLWILWRCHHGE